MIGQLERRLASSGSTPQPDPDQELEAAIESVVGQIDRHRPRARDLKRLFEQVQGEPTPGAVRRLLGDRGLFRSKRDDGEATDRLEVELDSYLCLIVRTLEDPLGRPRRGA